MRVAQRAARAVAVEVPAAAANDALLPRIGPVRIDVRRIAFRIRSVPVGRPLPDVAMHVGESPAIRREGSDWRRPLTERAGGERRVGKAAVEVRLVGGDVL